ncbi:MAG: hypothetical protein AAF363_09110 [Bacteroidota bacterium]
MRFNSNHYIKAVKLPISLMKMQAIVFSMLLFISVSCVDTSRTEEESSVLNENMLINGADVLAFGPDNVLFVGDSKGAKLYAVPTEAKELKDAIPYNMEGFDIVIAAKLNMEPRDVIINDMKIHPGSQEAYVSIKLGHQPKAKSVIAIVNPVTTDIHFLEIIKDGSKNVSIDNPASSDLVFWKETPASTLNITDIDYHDGYVYVAGLTNTEFASTLRKITYPFTDTQEMVNSIEIYHAVHTQNETRAPIRTMLFDEVGGKSTLLASYTCTPLVTIPIDEIQKGANVKGKTIAELGYGNTPIDMLIVTTQGFDGSTSKSLIVTNKNRGGTMIPLNAVIAGTQGKGMAGQRAMFAAGLEGMQEIPTANVMQVDIQNPQMLGVVRRNIETGDIDLVSELTGTFLRLSDFISEYDFPDYRYPEAQTSTKQYHDMVKQMEGYAELTSQKMGR